MRKILSSEYGQRVLDNNRCNQNCLKKEDPKTKKTAASRSTHKAPSKSNKPAKTDETSIHPIEMAKGKYISLLKRQETIGKV